MKRKLLSIIIILAALLVHSASGQAVQRVKADGIICYVDATATGSNDGSTWENAYLDLQPALGNLNCTEIHVATGTYYPGTTVTATFQLRSGLQLLGGYPSGGDDTADPSANPTILNGDIGISGEPSDNSQHVVTADNTDSSAVLDGFSILNATDYAGTGGGISISNGSPTLQNLEIQNNFASGGGCGIYLFNSSPSLTNIEIKGNGGSGESDLLGAGLMSEGNSSPVLNQVTFDSNIGTQGAGMYSAGGSPSLTDVTFKSNVSGGPGGGLYIDSGSVTISNGDFDGNTGTDGAGIYLNGGTLTMQNTQIQNGQAGVHGGGLYIAKGSTASVTGSTFYRNTANLQGGAIYSDAANPTLTNLTFDGNQASGDGGGLYINSGNLSLSASHFGENYISEGTCSTNCASNGAGIYVNGGNLAMDSTDLQNGHATNDGAGIYIASTGSATLRGSEIKRNTAEFRGGGLYVQGSLAMVGGSVTENIANDSGGGIALDGTSSADFVNLVVEQNQVMGGQGPAQGGGILATGSTASFTNLLLDHNSSAQGGGMALNSSDIRIVNATIADNNGGGSAGAAIYNDNTLTIANAVVWNNTNGSPSITSASAITDSLLQDPCPIGNCPGAVFSDPQFVASTAVDYRLLWGSPAVDAGDFTALPNDTYDLDGDGNVTERISQDVRGKPRISGSAVDMGAYEGPAGNINWTEAEDLNLTQIQPNVYSGSSDRFVDRQGQSQWFRFTVDPDSKLLVTLTNLGANYDLSLYTDISQAYDQLTTTQDLTKLSAEFAPDSFSPDSFSPDSFSPDSFSPDSFSPDSFSPDSFSPDSFSPDTFSPDSFSPDSFSPDSFSPDSFSPDSFSPDSFSPDTYSPDSFSPDSFSPDSFSPDLFSSAQIRALIAHSAHDGTQGEGILVNTWTRSGYFYVRVNGRNGAFAPDVPFHLQVTLLSGSCGPVNPVLPALDASSLPAGGYHTFILTDLAQTDGNTADKTLLESNLAALAERTAGYVLDTAAFDHVTAAATQAQANPACVYAMNLQAGAIKDIVDAFRKANPDLQYIVLVGDDHAIPFFRYPDNALLANESDYAPPVQDNTTSQASLKSGYILSQDAYGSSTQLSIKGNTLPIPDLAVGRLVETASDINHLLAAYLGTADGVVTPTNALVTGYDFLTDDANAVRDQLQASLGSSAVNTLIMDNSLSPAAPSAWTADDLRQSLLGSRHDLVFLAGHFSASSALAADYKTRLMASEVLASSTDFTNSLVYSAGCHSGYNIVSADDILGVTVKPDWAEVFAQKGATFIGGTGYQYGDTDFISYSEQLYLDFTEQLRYGSGPVAVGQALVQAKQAYIANTPSLRGIDEKAVLEATLFGLPMLQYNLPGRTAAPVDTSLVTNTQDFTNNPGLGLGLKWSDLHVTPTFSSHTVSMSETGGGTVDATYLEGPSGVDVNPAEPVLPLDMLNVSSPDEGYVLRGVGWRGGDFTNLAGIMPLTGAATQDLRAPHAAFFSDVFFPVRPWNINYFDALQNAAGATHLALMPAQYESSQAGSLTGSLRRFDAMDFRLYYSSNISTYTNADYDWSNTPAESDPPDISHISSTVNRDGTVSFAVTVTGDPAAGIQEAWIVYTYENGGSSGKWLPLDLQQDLQTDPDDTQSHDSRLWKGTLDLGGNPASALRFVVQAANGVGLVTMMTNEGAYYRAAVDPAVLPQGQLPVALNLDAPAASGPYGGQQSFAASLTQDGRALAGLPVTFNLGGLGRQAVTDGNGRATVNFYLAAQPGQYTLEAAFDGNDSYAPADSSSDFEINPASSLITLSPKTQSVGLNVSTQFTASVTSAGLPLVGKSVALTLDSDGANQLTLVAVTDYAGQATWQIPAQVSGYYDLKAWFGQPVSDSLDLSSPYYTGSFDTAGLSIVGKTDLHVTANPKTITYGDPIPTFDYSFTTSDFVTGHGAETVSGITCTAGAGPFSHAGSPYTITCSGGSSEYYNLIYATGKLTVNARVLTVTPNPAAATAQYSDLNPSAFSPSYSGWATGDSAAVLTTKPTCSTTRTGSSPAGTYDITCLGGAGVNYTFTYVKGSFTVTQENAFLQYSGDTLALVNQNLNLQVTVWDSAAAGYPATATAPESKPKATIGDITKMWVQFNIYPESTCGTSTSIPPVYARVSDAPTNGDGIGTASAVYKSTTEASYCVIARLVAGNTGGVNQYYSAPDAQPAAISYYQNSGKFASGAGSIKDPNGLMGIFGLIARNDAKGNPTGQLVYTSLGTYNSTPAVFIIRCSPLTSLQFTGAAYPLTVTLQGKCTIQVNRLLGGGSLYTDAAATFKAVVVDTNKTPASNNDSFALTVWDKTAKVYKTILTSKLTLGNIIIHLK